MSDDEDYNSEEDFDYVPTDGEKVSEEENSGDEEDLSILHDGDNTAKVTGKRKKTGKKDNSTESRKRKGGIKLDIGEAEVTDEQDNVSGGDEEEKARKKQLAEEIAKEEEEKKALKEKKKADDLWSSFMSDVKPLPKKPVPSSGLGSLSSQVKSPLTDVSKEKPKETKPKGKVTITKVFDFAGEEVKISKEVDANSKEALAEQKKLEKTSQEQQDGASTSSILSPGSSLVSGFGLKRPAVGGLGSVLNKINKKNKMGTLEKSKIDWDSFKRKEGIEEDLKIHNKGKQGYTERMAFLNRADQRQYEIERDIRLGTNSKR